jgi:hypothetical protein
MRALRLVVPILATIPLAGCELVGGIFKTGVWFGVIAVVVFIAIMSALAITLRD